MQDFAVTYRKHGKKSDTILKEDFKPLLDFLGKKLVTHVFEKDKDKDHVHLHGIIKISKTYYRKKLCFEGFNLKIKPIWGMDGWLKYLSKDQPYRQKIRFEIDCIDMQESYIPEEQQPLIKIY